MKFSLHPALAPGAALLLALGACGADAQVAGEPHAAHAEAPALSARARAQLAEARLATAALATPEAARAAGYHPVFGNVPLQGEHYVRMDLVASDRFDVRRPPVLVFAPVNGRPTLVGVAYAYQHPEKAPLPEGFDGAADVWHAHPRLARPGTQLVMVHAWFVEAPEGPFAHHNPHLPYRAAGLAPARGEHARALGMALALVAMPPELVEGIEARGGAALRRKTAPHREGIRDLVPRLAAAERTGDRAGYDRHAAEAVRHAEALLAAYRAAAPHARRSLDRMVDEFLGRGHGDTHVLDGI
jgi:hypothetical protein